MKLTPLFAPLLLILAGLGACASTPTARRYDDVLAHNDRRLEIEIFGDVVKACELDSSRTYFSYASADLDEGDKKLLGEVAQCLDNGKLAGRSILVTGYTDEIGTKPENKDLGMSRSQIVALELNSRGVAATRIFLRSRGETLAKGDTAGERAYDRKVELRIVEREI